MANTLKFGNGEWYGKKDTILAYNDENNNYKPLPFDFSRGSNATVINKDGLIETVGSGEPRIDYKDNSKGALLLEPSRTNIITQSEAFDNAYWTKSGSSVVGGFASPSADSPLGAFKLVEGTSNAKHFIVRNNLFTPDGLTRDYSIFVKEGERRYIYITNVTTLNNDINCVVFDTRNGVFTNTNDITYILNRNVTALSNGWYRIDFTSNTNSGAYDNFYIGISSSETMSGVSYQGDGTSGIYIYGAQIEQGSYATSYIPTQGGVVTRLAESCSQTPPDGVIGQTEGTMFVDCKINAQGTYTGFSLSDGTTNNEVIIRFTTTDRIEYYLRSGGSQPFGGGTTAFDTDSRVRIALAYKGGDSVIYVNGTEVSSSTNTTIPLNLSKVKFSRGNSTAVFSGKTNNFKVYNTRLSNSELQALTTI